ncbi:MAG TPA: hypothetical protein VGJ86_09965 [Acidimicrobiales bacterium]
MSDVVIFTQAGRTYRVMGLQAKARAISGASQEMDTLIRDRVQAASSALADWRGRHATHFGEDANSVLSKMAGLKISLWHASNVLSAFPDSPYGGLDGMYFVDGVYYGARIIAPPDDQTTASAVPAHLRGYSTSALGQDERFATLAAIVNLDGVTAEVSYERALTSGERQRRLDQGADPRFLDEETATQTDRVGDVSRLIPLPSPRADVPPLVTESRATSEFASAVAFAFEHSDQRLLDLLAVYPDLAGFIVDGLADGRVSGESSLAILLAWFSTFDTAAHGGNGDDRISREDLEAILRRGDLPPYVTAAARYLLANPVLWGLAENVESYVDPLGRRGDGLLSANDIRSFLEFNVNLRIIQQNFDAYDTADDGGRPDGRVSMNDLKAMAAGSGPMAAAAQYLLDHEPQRLRLLNYEAAKQSGGNIPLGMSPTMFTRNSVIGLSVDQQIYGDDPEAAHNFVRGLPVASGGHQGLPIWLCSDEGTRNLANAALMDTVGDLTETHGVIAHLPETTGAVRNRLITGYYDLLAQRADALFAGDLAGRPDAAGHPGANWLLFAPWASNGVHDVIAGDFSVFGIHPGMTDRQAAADGNQWIFNDIGGRYAGFIEMYERNPHPSEAELEAFFGTNFHAGDSHIRTGFSAYVAAMEETDPVRRQQLLFEGNTLVAMHEQSGVQPYLEEISTGPDELTVRYIDVHLGAGRFDVDRDLQATHLPNNHIVDLNILDLDPGGKTPVNYMAGVPGATSFAVGDGNHAGVIDMPSISGIESFDHDFPTSTHQWAQDGGEVTRVVPAGRSAYVQTIHPDPDSMLGTGATSWPDRSERMWYILKLFEQHHTDRELYRTADMNMNLDDIDWLEEATGLTG